MQKSSVDILLITLFCVPQKNTIIHAFKQDEGKSIIIFTFHF